MSEVFRGMTERPIDSLIPYEKNAKVHTDEQVEQIANSIRMAGFVQPVVVDRDNVVVIGHGRLMAAKKLGMRTVPCIMVDDLTPEQIKALRLADNKLSESPWDFRLLNEELADLEDFVNMGDFGFDLTPNLDDATIDSLFEDAPPKDKKPKMVKCPHCGESFEV